MTMLLPIGRFAQLSGLSTKALRLYDELGLLRPAAVDAQSRYRYYDAGQLAEGELIGRLRRIDLSLEEIGRFLGAQPGERRRILTSHRARLRARVAEASRALQELDAMTAELSSPPEPRRFSVAPMTRKTLHDQPVLRLRSAWRPDDPGQPGRDIAEVFAALRRQGLTLVAPPYCICPGPGDDELVHGEAGIPVDRIGAPEGRVEPAILPGERSLRPSTRAPPTIPPAAGPP